jgi:uncharacterized protein (PEP-CTERM system associated)
MTLLCFSAPFLVMPRRSGLRAGCGVSVLLATVLSAVAGLTDAQETAASPGQAQAGGRPNWLITPTVSVDGTYTDNVDLTPNKKSDFITRVSPGVTLDGRSGRASASLNYRWQVNTYADASGRNNNQRSLAANGKLEIVEQWLFLEASHNISQSTVSAFGTQSTNNELINANRSETAAYSISPYIQGRLAGAVDYQLRYSGTSARSETGALSGASTTTRSWTGRLSGATPLVPLGWSVNANQQVTGQGTGVDTRSSSVAGTLTYQIDPQVRLLANAGRESDNYTNAAQQKRTTRGIGLDWAPTERTKLSLKKDRNAAGNAFSVDFSHRTALTAWKFTDSRAISIPTPQLALASTGTAYDLLYQQLASSFPDPVLRAAETNRQLAQTGIAANSPIFGPLLTSRPFLQRARQASVALNGASNTVVFAVSRSDSEQLGTGVGAADDFALSPNIRQSGFNASWAHKLTPDTAMTLTTSNSRSTGSGLETLLKAWSLLLTSKVGANTSASVGLRQSRFDGAAGAGYDEHALTGSMQFKF